jgi:hypothetical protein
MHFVLSKTDELIKHSTNDIACVEHSLRISIREGKVIIAATVYSNHSNLR